MSTIVYYPDKFTIDDTKYAKTGSNIFVGNQVVTGNITLNGASIFAGTASYALVAAAADTTKVATIPQLLTGSNQQYGLKVHQSGSGNSVVVQNESDPINSKAFFITNSGSVGIGKTQAALPYIPTPNVILEVVGNTILSGNLEISGGIKLNNNAITSSDNSVPLRFSGSNTIANVISASILSSSGDIHTNGGNIKTSASILNIGGASTTSSFAGNLVVSGNTILGDNSSDNVTFSGSSLLIPNNLNIDNNTLFIDSTNDKIGIGTNTPSEKLHVNGNVFINGSGDTAGIISNQPKFYIVTSSVLELEIGRSANSIILGNYTNTITYVNRFDAIELTGANVVAKVKATSPILSASSEIVGKKLKVNTTNDTSDINTAGTFTHFGNILPGAANQYSIGNAGSEWNASLNNVTASGLVIPNRNIGIGTANPNSSYKLDITGDIRITEGMFFGSTIGSRLNDYEEGTFAATFQNNWTNHSGEYHSYYVKIGRYIFAKIWWGRNGTNISTTGNATITGFPFASSQTGTDMAIGTVYTISGYTSNWTANPLAQQTYCYLSTAGILYIPVSLINHQSAYIIISYVVTV